MADNNTVPDYIANPTTEYGGNCAGCGRGMTNMNQSTNNPSYHQGCDPENEDDDE